MFIDGSYQGTPCSHAEKMQDHSTLLTPCPHLLLFLLQDCSYFNSNAVPLKLSFQNVDPLGENIRVIFKVNLAGCLIMAVPALLSARDIWISEIFQAVLLTSFILSGSAPFFRGPLGTSFVMGTCATSPSALKLSKRQRRTWSVAATAHPPPLLPWLTRWWVRN